jgi:hypothetical protein
MGRPRLLRRVHVRDEDVGARWFPGHCPAAEVSNAARAPSRANLRGDPEPHTEPSLRDRLRRPLDTTRTTLSMASIGTSRWGGQRVCRTSPVRAETAGTDPVQISADTSRHPAALSGTQQQLRVSQTAFALVRRSSSTTGGSPALTSANTSPGPVGLNTGTTKRGVHHQRPCLVDRVRPVPDAGVQIDRRSGVAHGELHRLDVDPSIAARFRSDCRGVGVVGA